MPVELSSLPLLLKNAEVKLFHRTQKGWNSVLKIEADTGVKNVDILSLDKISEVPCEVVEGKKQKLRFNAELLEIGQHNETVQQLLKKTLLLMLEQFFVEWTVDAPIANNNRFAAFCELQTILMQEAPLIEVDADYHTSVTWKVTPAHLPKSSRKTQTAILGKFFDKFRDSVFVMVRNVLPPQKPVKNLLNSMVKLPVDPPSQVVDFLFCRKDIRKTLISLEFAGFPPLDDSLNHSLHRVEFNPNLKLIRLDLFPKIDRCHYFWKIPHNFCVFGYTRWSKTNGTLMIDCAQLRVQELRRDLTNSIKNYPKAMVFGSNGKTEIEKPVEVMFLSTNSVIVQVETQSPIRRSSLSGRFCISPVTNAPPPNWNNTLNSPSKPLHVNALTSQMIRPNVVSPSESIDSGVASPGAISSDEDQKAKLQRAAADTTFRVPKMRDRSASECYPMQQIPTVPGLKSILKKPHGSTFSVNAPTGILRRSTASRSLFARSVSECHDDMVPDFDFSNESNDTLASESPPGHGGFFRVDEEDEESSFLTDSEMTEMQPRKKRVSFSEHVQARIYRSNSSILGSKKKNEKRRKRKDMKKDSLSGNETTLNGDDLVSFEDDDISELSECRRDSGFADTPSSIIESPTKRIQRVISTDSAIDEEFDSDIEKGLEMLTVA